jgi:hypothetical protein
MGGFEVCNLPATYSWRSVPHIPHHSMETRTSFFWGVGVSTSLMRMSRRAWNWAARMVGVGFGEGDPKVVRGSWNGLCRDEVTGEWRTRNDIYLGDGLQTRCGVCLEHTDHKLTSATGSQDPAHGIIIKSL